jgi:hypothetical protein
MATLTTHTDILISLVVRRTKRFSGIPIQQRGRLGLWHLWVTICAETLDAPSPVQE